MFKKSMLIAAFLLLAVSITACKPNRPKGCPKLYPCTVQIIQGGAPLADANVQLIPDNPDLVKWAVTSVSDAEGKVVLMTQTFPGAPLGKYKVTVSKSEADLSNLPPIIINHVAEEYGQRETTPLTLEVVKGMVDAIQIDVGEAP